jgi:hypothetical protein
MRVHKLTFAAAGAAARARPGRARVLALRPHHRRRLLYAIGNSRRDVTLARRRAEAREAQLRHEAREEAEAEQAARKAGGRLGRWPA